MEKQSDPERTVWLMHDSTGPWSTAPRIGAPTTPASKLGPAPRQEPRFKWIGFTGQVLRHPEWSDERQVAELRGQIDQALDLGYDVLVIRLWDMDPYQLEVATGMVASSERIQALRRMLPQDYVATQAFIDTVAGAVDRLKKRPGRQDAKDALDVVDMQVRPLDGLPQARPGRRDPAHQALAAMVRQTAGPVVWIRHCGKAGDGFERGSKGWAFLPELDRQPADVVVEKTLNDSFAGTALHDTRQAMAPDWVPDLRLGHRPRVDSTVRRLSPATTTSSLRATPIRSATARTPRRAHRHPPSSNWVERPLRPTARPALPRQAR